jgi:hypothetical protein
MYVTKKESVKERTHAIPGQLTAPFYDLCQPKSIAGQKNLFAKLRESIDRLSDDISAPGAEKEFLGQVRNTAACAGMTIILPIFPKFKFPKRSIIILHHAIATYSLGDRSLF